MAEAGKKTASEYEPFTFVDGGRATHTAQIEPGAADGPDTLVLNLFGKAHRIPIRLYHEGDETAPQVGQLAGNVSQTLAFVSYALLYAFRNVWCVPYGCFVALDLNGRRLLARYQEHPPDAGIASPHPGVTVYEHRPEAS